MLQLAKGLFPQPVFSLRNKAGNRLLTSASQNLAHVFTAPNRDREGVPMALRAADGHEDALGRRT
jgi:hypothetical protein